MNKQNLRPCIGGWLLIAGGALDMMLTLIPVLFNWIIRSMPLRYIRLMLGYRPLDTIIFALPLIIIGIMLVIKKQGIPVVIGCAAGLVAKIAYPILGRLLSRFFGLATYTTFDFTNILYCLPYVLLALTALISASQQSGGLKKLWFLSGSVYGALAIYWFIYDIIMIIRHHAINFSNIFNIIIYLLLDLVIAAGFIFTGQWLADPYRKQPAYRPAPQTPQGNYYQQPQYYQPPQPQYYQPQYQQPVQPQPVPPRPVQPKPAATISVVKELERAKGLLDSGAITQEEYDQLKKRLLN